MPCNLVKIYQSFGEKKVLPPSSRQKRQYSPLKHKISTTLLGITSQRQ
jgi:hypothetical protein